MIRVIFAAFAPCFYWSIFSVVSILIEPCTWFGPIHMPGWQIQLWSFSPVWAVRVPAKQSYASTCCEIPMPSCTLCCLSALLILYMTLKLNLLISCLVFPELFFVHIAQSSWEARGWSMLWSTLWQIFCKMWKRNTFHFHWREKTFCMSNMFTVATFLICYASREFWIWHNCGDSLSMLRHCTAFCVFLD